MWVANAYWGLGRLKVMPLTHCCCRDVKEFRPWPGINFCFKSQEEIIFSNGNIEVQLISFTPYRCRGMQLSYQSSNYSALWLACTIIHSLIDLSTQSNI